MTGRLVSQAPVTLQLFEPGNSARETPTEGVLLLHGFPGETNQQNQDLAAFLAHSLCTPCYVLHYSGLGMAPGSFSFLKSISEGESATRFLTTQAGHSKVHLVGHSWGGLVALNLLRSHAPFIQSLTLLSPLTQMIPPQAARHLITQLQSERPKLFSLPSVEDVLAEIELVRDRFEPIQFAQTLPSIKHNILLVQAAHDQEVLPITNQRFTERANNSVKYLELPQGHTFLEDRDALFKTVLHSIQTTRDAC